MYDHLPPRLAKYLAAIYTGTDVPEIEQDIDGRLDAFAVACRHRTKLSSWNKQRGQKINQLNRIICNQRLKMRELNRQIEFEKWMVDNRSLWLEVCRRNFSKVEKWNNAHKREIAQLQNKLHGRRIEVKFLLRQLEDRNSLLKLKNKSIDDLVGMLHSEKRKARELKRQVDKLNEFADVSCRVNNEFDIAVRKQDEELADWYEYAQLLIAELNKRDEKIEALGKQYKHKCRSNDALASMLYDRDCEFK